MLNWGMLPWLALVLATQLPGLRPLAKFLPHATVTLPLAVALAAAGLWLLLNPPRWLKAWLATPWPMALTLPPFALLIAWAYPLVDGRKLVGGGSDADDALIVGATQLWHLASPYVATTYFGNPLSPGPGWIALAAPFSLAGLEPLLPVLALAAFACALPDWPTRNRVWLALLACPLTLELATSGNDLPALALLLMATTLALLKTRRHDFALALLLGTLATGRIVLPAWPLLAGFLLWAQSPARAMRVTLAALATTALWHAAFIALTPGPYAPLHLLGKGEHLMTPALAAFSLLALAAAAAAMLRHRNTWPATTHLALGLAVPFACLALADLAARDYALSLWEGANYLIPALPAVALAAVCGNKKPRAGGAS